MFNVSENLDKARQNHGPTLRARIRNDHQPGSRGFRIETVAPLKGTGRIIVSRSSSDCQKTSPTEDLADRRLSELRAGDRTKSTFGCNLEDVADYAAAKAASRSSARDRNCRLALEREIVLFPARPESTAELPRRPARTAAPNAMRQSPASDSIVVQLPGDCVQSAGSCTHCSDVSPSGQGFPGSPGDMNHGHRWSPVPLRSSRRPVW
jgi:hypothetical protein